MDSRKKRDGAAIEELGWYNPISTENNCVLNSERILYWLKEGAQPTDATKKLLKKTGIAFKWHLINSGLDEKNIEKELKKWELEKEASKKEKVKKNLDAKVSSTKSKKEKTDDNEKSVENKKEDNIKILETSNIDEEGSSEEE